jgi:hypothetical protein
MLSETRWMFTTEDEPGVHHRYVHEWRDTCTMKPACRPVVVLDPKSSDDVDALADAMAAAGDSFGWASRSRAALRSLVAPPVPPKPAEPTGLGAVVVDAKGSRWIRIDTHQDCNDWTAVGAPKNPDPDASGVRWEYAAIDAVAVLSEGVTE